MSLRTSYSGPLAVALDAARVAGLAIVESAPGVPQTALVNAMVAAANRGEAAFTYTAGVNFQPDDLRMMGPLWYAFQTGVYQALANEDIMLNEVDVDLNTSDQIMTQVDIRFDFSRTKSTFRHPYQPPEASGFGQP